MDKQNQEISTEPILISDAARIEQRQREDFYNKQLKTQKFKSEIKSKMSDIGRDLKEMANDSFNEAKKDAHKNIKKYIKNYKKKLGKIDNREMEITKIIREDKRRAGLCQI